MITEEKKDFTEAKRVLDDLKAYAEGKIAKRNQTNTGAPAIEQEMTLASQPEVVSDHLEEESVLPPLDATIEAVANTGVSQENATSIASTNGTEVLNAGIGSGDTQTATELVQNDSSKEDAIANISQQGTNSETVEAAPITSPSTLHQGEMTTSVQATDINNMANSGMDASLELVNASLNTGTDEALESVPKESTIGGQALENGNLQNVASLDTGNSTVIQQEAIGNGETLNGPISEGLTTANSIPDTQAIPKSTGSSIVDNNDSITGLSPQPVAIPQIDVIPEISIPGQDMDNSTDNYQASANGAQAVLSDIAPAVSDTNVVMPSGTTEEEANDQTLVVGPEAFTPSR